MDDNDDDDYENNERLYKILTLDRNQFFLICSRSEQFSKNTKNIEWFATTLSKIFFHTIDGKYLTFLCSFALLITTTNWYLKFQLISKGQFGVLKSTKKNSEIFIRISALASKAKKSNPKNKVTLFRG